MLNLNSLILFSENPGALATFYERVLAHEPEWSEGEYRGFKVGPGFLMIGPHDKVHGKNPNPERIMFNLETDDVKGEFLRIEELGAQIIAQPYNPMENSQGWLATLADPDGNYFQLASPM